MTATAGVDKRMDALLAAAMPGPLPYRNWQRYDPSAAEGVDEGRMGELYVPYAQEGGPIFGLGQGGSVEYDSDSKPPRTIYIDEMGNILSFANMKSATQEDIVNGNYDLLITLDANGKIVGVPEVGNTSYDEFDDTGSGLAMFAAAPSGISGGVLALVVVVVVAMIFAVFLLSTSGRR